MASSRPVVIVVDDNEEHILFIERGLHKADVKMDVVPFVAAESAQTFLQEFSTGARTLPKDSVILADIKMPGASGFDLVEWIRGQPALELLRVFFVTSSNDPADRDTARKLGADGYCVKFPNPDVYRRIIENNGPIAACDV